MLISHEHRLIFIKTRKTAGTSIEIALSQHIGPDDVLTPDSADDPERTVPAQNYRIPATRWTPRQWVAAAGGKEIRFYHHIPAVNVRRVVGRRIWNDYLTVAVDRNPWDLAVSAYHWLRYQDQRRGRTGRTFPEFVASDDLAVFSNWRLYTHRNKVIVEDLLRFDIIAEEIEDLAFTIKLDLDLPRAKSTQRTDRKPYQDWYTPDTKSRVAEVFRREIAHFGWTFG